MKVGFVGATDRMNYGDLLFPLIAKRVLEAKIPHLEIVNYSTTESDLSTFGAMPTRSMKHLNQDRVDAVIVVGGEVITATWKSTFLHLQANYFVAEILRVIFKLIGNRLSDAVIKRKFNIPLTQCFPWILDGKSYKGIPVFYNGVSGTDFVNLNKHPERVQNAFKSAIDIAVRDAVTKNNLNNVGVRNVVIVPDSAFIMSDIFKPKDLELAVDSATLALQNEKYVAFQVGVAYGKGNVDTIVSQLKMIQKEGYKIVLLPIGRAALHEDQIVLAKILRKLSGDVEMIEGNVFDIMYTISNADAFIGTSLHGNITALSYGVPSIGLDSRVTKLTAFLDQFGTQQQMAGVNYVDIYSSFVKTMKNVNSDELSKNAVDIKRRVNLHFDDIASRLNDL